MFMTSSRRNKALFIILAICLGICAWQVQFAGAKAQAQKTATPPPQKEEIPPDSDYMYRKDSAAIDEIKQKETDPQKRADALVAWVSAHPRATRAIAYAAAYYDEVVRVALKSDPQRALAMIQTFQNAAPANTSLIALQMSAYYQTKNWAKAAEIGEKIYADKPSAGLANDLANIYQQAGNSDKYIFYAEKVLADVGIEKGYAIALQIANVHIQKKEMTKALPLLAQLMTAYGDKVPQGIQEPNWNQTRAFAFGVMAADSYAKKDLAKAIELYERVTRFAPKTEDAWYFIGMARWQGKDQKGAIEPFAKAYVIGGKLYSQKAKDNMEQLWKAEHNGSLDGLDAVIAKAKSDLGIS
jgi:tetratricopeptide (TPR) repeat protein